MQSPSVVTFDLEEEEHRATPAGHQIHVRQGLFDERTYNKKEGDNPVFVPLDTGRLALKAELIPMKIGLAWLHRSQLLGMCDASQPSDRDGDVLLSPDVFRLLRSFNPSLVPSLAT